MRRPVREGTDGKFGRGMVRMEGGVECGWVERWSGVGYEVVEGLCCGFKIPHRVYAAVILL